ncbi:multisubunit sodium/proton antiporter MrpA subunit [Prauserella shujinwangii]|uniref:Multisubunit sodium/proton antiporter MrpA subunit n=1 Tax=Prauserella shujinwangii TaxID=1453103 RepID=A0A2T0LRS3_9PSEU|nr:hydrogen gas-evolving membrane-bound hydrogenase subunit E [Prauserella shujinwangii]PRX46201.1 multisubunit sodium/proton antiporter MrpA subunit [Prauserella shujinwangii]
MLIAIAAHFAVAAMLPLAARRCGRAAFAIGALVPAGSLALALTYLPGVLRGTPHGESVHWAERIGLLFTVRLDALAMLMTLLVTGVGAVVLCYFGRYADRDEPGHGRQAGLMVAFAGAMLGLVLADDVLSLYVYWEITTIASFLLVGGAGRDEESRRSAKQALVVTVFGGLALLLGLIVLAVAAGTFRLSGILADPPDGAAVTAAVALLLVGVATKSAQVPFHPWLPAAMVAPTPVSAYLHAAAMVKAGVYLAARLAPAFADRPVFWVPLVVLGLWTMVLGGFRALRQHDLKLLLAFGTVSQLGFLLVLVAVGTYTAALAGAAMLLAHGLFKSTLFLTAGAVDKGTGTRDIRELSGLGRQWPQLATLAGLAAASMAGLPPLLGFVGKEAALKAFLHATPKDVAVLCGITAGSVFTVAYTLRFLVGAFGTRPGAAPSRAKPPGAVFTAAIAVPALAGLVVGPGVGWLAPLAAGYAEALPGAHDYHLALWHGLTPPLLLSVLVLATGYAVYRAGRAVAVVSGRVPEPLRAQRGYDTAVSGLIRLAHGGTGRIQTGSLPVYLAVILLTVVAAPGTMLLLRGLPAIEAPWSRSWLQLPLAAIVLAAAGAVLRARRRLTAVLLTGMIGYGVGGLFLVRGAIDLALAQFLVETLTLVVFVLVLRRLPPPFARPGRERTGGQARSGQPALRRAEWRKALVAALGGTFVAVLATAYSAGRERLPPASAWYVDNAKPEAGATNVVNAILVDFRALDTIGEITVLLVAATGAASLALGAGRARRRTMPRPGRDERTEVRR